MTYTNAHPHLHINIKVMSNIDDIISKIQKLLALSESSNENEAINAMAHARNLLEKYNIEENDVLGRRKNQNDFIISTMDYTARSNKLKYWEARLLSVIAPAFFCVGVFNKTNLNIVGTDFNIRVSRDVFIRVRMHLISLSYKRMAEYGRTVREIARDEFNQPYIDLRKTKGNFRPVEFRLSWLEGTISGIDQKLKKQNIEFIWQYRQKANQIIVSDMNAIREYARKIFDAGEVEMGKISDNDIGYKIGQKDGKEVSMHRGDLVRDDGIFLIG